MTREEARAEIEEEEEFKIFLEGTSLDDTEILEEKMKENVELRKVVEANRMAIKALEQEPKAEKIIKMRDATPEEKESIDKYIKSISKPTGVDFWNLEQEPCEDCISRQAVINAIANTCFWLSADNWEELMKSINSISPIRPQEPKTGHWIGIDEKSAVCSCCNRNNTLYGDFCKWCGADMRKEQNEDT